MPSPPQEVASLAKRQKEVDARTSEAERAGAEARSAASAAARAHHMLQQHLELLRAEAGAASTQMEDDRQRYEAHLADLRAKLAACKEALGLTAAQ